MAQSSVQLIVDAGGALNPIRQVQRASQALSAQFESLKNSAKNAANGALDLGRTLEQNTRKLREQTTSVQGLIGAYAGFRTLKGAITAGVELETAEKRAELLTQRFAQLSGIQGVAAQSADKFRIAQSDTLAALIDLGNRLGPQGASLAEIRDVYDGFNTVLAINKVSTQEAASAQLQLNQALGSGRLAGEEFRAVNEATPQVIDAVAKVLGVARGEVKKLAADGAVTAPVLIQALRDIKDQGADVLEQSFDSASGRLRAFQKAQTELAQAIGIQLLPAFTPVISAVTDLIRKFAALPGPAQAVIAGVVGITTALVALAPVITGAIGLLKALGVATLVAAGPWVALAAGITAAAVALASYQSQAQKTAKGAATGGVAEMKKANDELYIVNSKINKLIEKRESTTKGNVRGAIDRQLRNLRASQTELQKGLAAGRKVTAAQDLTGGLVTGAPTGEEDTKKDRSKKERESRVPELTRELGLLRSLGVLQAKIAEAETAKNQSEVIRLNGIQRGVELLHEAAAIQASDVPLAEKNLQLAMVEEKLDQSKYKTLKELAALDLQQRQAGLDRLQNLNDEQELLRARLNGNEAEVMLNQQIRDIMKDTKGLSEEDVRLKLQSINADKKRIEEAQQLKQLFSDIGMSIKSGVVDAITSAVEGTKTLSEVANNMLRNIANKLLDVAVNMALFGAISGTGTGGGLLGGLFKRANGGSVMAGQSYLVGERGPELFTPARSGGIAPSGSFGSSNIVVNVDATGSSVQGDQPNANRLGEALGAAVRAELVRQRRPGGLLA